MNGGGDFPATILALIDNFNQSTNNTTTEFYPDDDVTGYTVELLNNIILNVYNVTYLKNQLKNNKPTGVTDAQIDTLFNRYIEIWYGD